MNLILEFSCLPMTDGSISFDTSFVTQTAREVGAAASNTCATSPLLSFERHNELEKRTINFLPRIVEQRSEENLAHGQGVVLSVPHGWGSQRGSSTYTGLAISLSWSARPASISAPAPVSPLVSNRLDCVLGRPAVGRCRVQGPKPTRLRTRLIRRS